MLSEESQVDAIDDLFTALRPVSLPPGFRVALLDRARATRRRKADRQRWSALALASVAALALVSVTIGSEIQSSNAHLLLQDAIADRVLLDATLRRVAAVLIRPVLIPPIVAAASSGIRATATSCRLIGRTPEGPS